MTAKLRNDGGLGSTGKMQNSRSSGKGKKLTEKRQKSGLTRKILYF